MSCKQCGAGWREFSGCEMPDCEWVGLAPDHKVTVCDKCFRASCWQGEFMCDAARGAGTTVKTVSELRAGNYGEHENYWKN